MAKIRRRRVVQGVIDRLGLQRNFEKVPEEVLTKVVPTYDIAEKGNVKYWKTTSSNDNDITITPVPDGQLWEIDMLRFRYQCSATVGTRLVSITLTRGSDEIYYTFCDTTYAANANTYNHFSPHIGTTESTNGTHSFQPFPKYLRAGDTIRIRDNAAVSATDDIHDVVILYKEFTEPSAEE